MEVFSLERLLMTLLLTCRLTWPVLGKVLTPLLPGAPVMWLRE